MLKEKIVAKFYRDVGGHGFDHIQRVHRLAMLITKKEKADVQIVDAAAWLHDIARAKEDEGKVNCHAEEGSKMAKKYLTKISFPKNKISAVSYAISVHRFSKGKKAKTIEAKILQDADRLDALGAICIARVLMHNGYKCRPLYDPKIKVQKHYRGQYTTAINHFYEKILKIKPSRFHTKTARKIAVERYKFIVIFLNKFKEEWAGVS